MWGAGVLRGDSHPDSVRSMPITTFTILSRTWWPEQAACGQRERVGRLTLAHPSAILAHPWGGPGVVAEGGAGGPGRSDASASPLPDSRWSAEVRREMYRARSRRPHVVRVRTGGARPGDAAHGRRPQGGGHR